jgi:hypothetical protein
LKLIAFALQRVLDGLKALQQTFRRQVLVGRIFRSVRKATGDAVVAERYAIGDLRDVRDTLTVRAALTLVMSTGSWPRPRLDIGGALEFNRTNRERCLLASVSPALRTHGTA